MPVRRTARSAARRTARSAVLVPLAATATAVVIGLPGLARAHGDTLKVEVTGNREGRVTAVITWENDNDPLDEPVAGTVNAVSADGARLQGPWRLVADPGTPNGWTTKEALPSGTWKVSVDAAFPGLGHAERSLTVNPAGTGASAPPATRGPGAEPVATTAPVAAPPAKGRPVTSEARRTGRTSATWWTAAGVVVAAAAGAAVGVLVRRARARRAGRA
ncbi:hypothetical protein [Streptomyces sp. NPDC101132]|uniref:hypothetical protein n=1 Tax=Streptomyces sp. NPDC101132 TaxID=3366110 RepID=UPI0037FDB2C2